MESVYRAVSLVSVSLASTVSAAAEDLVEVSAVDTAEDLAEVVSAEEGSAEDSVVSAALDLEVRYYRSMNQRTRLIFRFRRFQCLRILYFWIRMFSNTF